MTFFFSMAFKSAHFGLKYTLYDVRGLFLVSTSVLAILGCIYNLPGADQLLYMVDCLQQKAWMSSLQRVCVDVDVVGV